MVDFIVIESGGTKSTWAFGNYIDGLIEIIESVGLHPQELTQEKSASIKSLLKNIHFKPFTKVFFYGAGCSEVNKPQIINFLKQFSLTNISVRTDLEGACIASLQDKSGYTAILGTGAIAAKFDGKQVVKTTSGYGYLLGDEGSGFDLGKRVLRSYFNGELNKVVAAQVEAYFDGKESILSAVYRNDGRFKVAGLTKIIHENRNLPVIQTIILASFEDFYEQALHKLNDVKEISFIGSIAYYFRDELIEVLSSHAIKIIEIQPSAIRGLFDYHFHLSNKSDG